MQERRIERLAAAKRRRSVGDPPARLDERERRLYQSIYSWRSVRAERDGLPGHTILLNNQVAVLSKTRPLSRTALLEIAWIGPGRSPIGPRRS